jgi:proteasome lid subunit RPN8/RPN11
MLPRDVLAQVLAHCAESSPREAVGLLGGRAGGSVDVALPLGNIASNDRAFVADPYSQYKALQRLESDDHDLLAIYHSHPGGGLEPSPEDLVYARRWPCAHLIVALTDSIGGRARFAAFRHVPDGIEHVAIRVLDAEVKSQPFS